MSVQLVGPQSFVRRGRYPFRRTFVVAEALIGGSGLAGTWQLLEGRWTPPVSALEPLGLHSWRLPGVWLFSSVAVPAGVATWLAWTRHEQAPAAVLAASGLLGVELAVQVPFLGLHPLQAVYGAPALALGALAVLARRRGWGGEAGSGGPPGPVRLRTGRSRRT